jgi:peptide/nickel transport system substrate-binding protein
MNNIDDRDYRISRRGMLTGAGATAAALGFAGTISAARAQQGGVLRIAFSDANTSDNLDPALAQNNFFIVPPQGLMYESLVLLDNNFQPHPQLAESWESSNNAKTWTFHLKKGVEFHDGSTMTSKDVVWSLRSAMDPKSGSTFYAQLKLLLKPENIVAIDANTVKFDLESPFVFFPNPLGVRNARIFKDGYSQADFAKSPIGTGPFRFKSFEPGQSFAATKFTNYWQPGKPHLDEVQFKNIPEDASKMQALLTGEVDLIDNIAFATSAQLNGTDYEALPLKDAAWHGIICDTKVPPFNDPRVVMAMKLAVDRHQVQQTVYSGFASLAADTPIPISDTYFPSDVEPRHRDVQGAKDLLKAAGHPNGLTIPHPLITVFGFGTNNLAAVVKQQLADAGITISIQEGGPTFWDTVWAKQPFYVPDFNRRHPAEIFPLISVTNAGQWMTHWSNPDFDAAVQAAAQTSDLNTQKANYGKAIKLQNDNDGIVLAAYAYRLHAKTRKLRGVVPNFVSFFDFTDASFV